MQDNAPTTTQKALAINLDPLKYGTIAEIGAGQEVARCFFQAGAAAGTIAKTMSAYDMNFSDEIYGMAPGGRYVSRPRLEAMLRQEFDLVLNRLENHRPEQSTFFAFANTVSTLGFEKRKECHGWLGIRLQHAPKSAPDEVILHVRLLDDSNIEQQEALGILGVNLIFGCYYYRDNPKKLLKSLMDNLRWGRAEIDLVELHGPTLGTVNNRQMAIELVNASLTRAIMFNPAGKIVMPADALYKKNVISIRCGSHRAQRDEINRVEDIKKSLKDSASDVTEILPVAEISICERDDKTYLNTDQILSDVSILCGKGFYVLISEFFRYFRIRQYLSRYTSGYVGIGTDTDEFEALFDEELYRGLPGGLLEGIGQVFPDKTFAFVYPSKTKPRYEGPEDISVPRETSGLLQYLFDQGKVIPKFGSP